jgi:ankyrin repeat protein
MIKLYELTRDLELFKKHFKVRSIYNVNHAFVWAACNGHLNLVKYLVKLGADVTARDNDAVVWAASNGHLSVVKYLVELGADITARNNIAVIWAASDGYLELVEDIEGLNK